MSAASVALGKMSDPVMRLARAAFFAIAVTMSCLLLIGFLAEYWSTADLINIAGTPVAWAALTSGLMFAWLSRANFVRVIIGITAAILGGFYLLPFARPTGCTADKPTIRLLWYNLGGADDRDFAGTDGWLRSWRADIVGLGEAKGGERSAVAVRLRNLYPVAQSCLGNGRCSTLLFSKLPVAHSEGLASGDPENRRALSAAMMGQIRGPKIVAVHLSWPLPPGKQREELMKLFTAIGNDPQLIVMGDFNMTETMRGFQQFLNRTGLRSANVGRATWPLRIESRAGIPVLAIDHILLGEAWGVRSIRVVEGPPSDHRGLVADICRL